MALTYDFDIRWIVPGNKSGQGHYVALFRDPRTVEALKGADEKLRRWLAASGFGFTVFDSGAGPGRYPAKDETARIEVLGRLSENMRIAELKGAALNGFSMPAFLKAIVEATPVGRGAAGPVAQPPVPAAAAAVAPGAGVAGTVAGSGAGVKPLFDIDAAFANPKRGAPVAVPEGRAPTLDDILSGPALAAAGGGVAVAEDDLRYHPTALPAEPSQSGFSRAPLLVLGGVVLLLIVVVGLGDAQSTTIVIR